MKTQLAFVILVILLLITTISVLLYEIRKLCKKIHQFDDAALWHKLAYTDGLTGVYNRTAYNNVLSEIQKTGSTEGFGIVLFDIDNFKQINDGSGHLVGDLTLQLVAKTILSVFSTVKCKVFRIGGDEFAVISEKTTEEELIDSLIRFRRALEEKTDVHISMGYSIIDGDVRKAFENADEMLYTDKASRKKE